MPNTLQQIMLAIACAGSAACTTDVGYKVVMTQDVLVSSPGGKPSLVKKGETVVIDSATHIEAAGHVGLLVVPINAGGGQAEVALRPIDDWGGSRLDEKSNGQLDELVSAINEVQRLLSERRATEALQAVEGLQRKYPKVSYVNFIKASCLVVLNQKDRALEALGLALADFPTNPGGRLMYRALAGKEYEEAKAH